MPPNFFLKKKHMTGHKSLQVRSALDIPYARRIPYENYIFLQEKLPTRKAVKDETKVSPIMQKRADKRRQDAPKGESETRGTSLISFVE
jgi:hypothetical protein